MNPGQSVPTVPTLLANMQPSTGCLPIHSQIENTASLGFSYNIIPQTWKEAMAMYMAPDVVMPSV